MGFWYGSIPSYRKNVSYALCHAKTYGMMQILPSYAEFSRKYHAFLACKVPATAQKAASASWCVANSTYSVHFFCKVLLFLWDCIGGSVSGKAIEKLHANLESCLVSQIVLYVGNIFNFRISDFEKHLLRPKRLIRS